jgi:two-component system response regulator BaeR
MSASYRIAFLDNSVQHIFSSVEMVRGAYPNTQLFTHETELLESMRSVAYDLIVMNLDIAPNDAIQVLREMRTGSPQNQPFVVIYSLQQNDFIQELAFDSGADAFVTFHRKPLVLKLFIANLLARRTVKSPAKPELDFEVDKEKYLVYRRGQPFQLPRKEFQLFEMLFNNSGRFFSKREIATEIWKDEKIALRRTIDVHIYNIRQFFGKRVIQSQKGRGYRINKKFMGAAASFAGIGFFLL